MKINFLLFFQFIHYCFTSTTNEELIVELSDKTFHNFLKENNGVFIEFYTQRCPHCSQFESKFLELSKKIIQSNINVKFAKLDAQKYDAINKEYNAHTYPFFLYIENNQEIIIEYKGERKIDSIFNFIEKKQNKTINELKTIEEFNKAKQSNITFILIFSKNNYYQKLTKISLKFSKLQDNFDVYFSNSIEISNFLNCKMENSIFLNKNFEEGPTILNLNNDVINSFENWLQEYSRPSIFEISNSIIQSAFHDNNTIFILLKNNSTEKYIMNNYYLVAKKNKVFYSLSRKITFFFMQIQKIKIQ